MAIRHRYEGKLSKKELEKEMLEWDKQGYVVVNKNDYGGATSLTLVGKKISPKELYGNQFYNTQQIQRGRERCRTWFYAARGNSLFSHTGQFRFEKDSRKRRSS